jgi:hypothetical protein
MYLMVCSIQAVDPSEHFLEWEKPAVNVMIIKKIMETDVTQRFKEMCRWLVEVGQLVTMSSQNHFINCF